MGTTLTVPPSPRSPPALAWLAAEREPLDALSPRWTQPAGMTEVVQRSEVSQVSAAMGDQALATVGPTGDRTATYPTAQPLAGALVPPATGPVARHLHVRDRSRVRLVPTILR